MEGCTGAEPPEGEKKPPRRRTYAPVARYTPRMGHSYTNLLVHIITVTKGREPLIPPELRPRLDDYIGGIMRAERCVLLAAGGMPDHSHRFVRMHPSVSVSDLMRVVKSRSSGWARDTIPAMRGFGWQEGHGSFSVSQSGADTVRAYIAGQEEHHRGLSFEGEFVAFLDRHGIGYDPRYLWE